MVTGCAQQFSEQFGIQSYPISESGDHSPSVKNTLMNQASGNVLTAVATGGKGHQTEIMQRFTDSMILEAEHLLNSTGEACQGRVRHSIRANYDVDEGY